MIIAALHLPGRRNDNNNDNHLLDGANNAEVPRPLCVISRISPGLNGTKHDASRPSASAVGRHLRVNLKWTLVVLSLGPASSAIISSAWPLCASSQVAGKEA